MNDFSKSSLVRSEQNLQNYQLTEIGYIPKDWNVLKLESLVTYRNGVAHEDCIETSGEYVVVNSKFISTDGDVKKYSSQCRLSAFSREILMVMSDVPNGKAIAKCYFVKDDDLLTINQRICALKSINSDSKYLFYVLNRNAFYLAFDDGAKQTNLRRQDVLDCPIAIPSRQEEQTAIANALSDVDALIQELEKLIAKKQAIKTATMQQLLTGRTRLPQFAHHPDGRKKGYKPSELGEIPEDWEFYNLPEKVWFQEGPGLRKWQFTNKGLKVINVTNLQENGFLDLDRTDRHVSWEEFEKTYKHFACDEGDLVIASSGNSYCKVSIVRECDLPLLMNTSVIRFKPLDNFSKQYMDVFLKSKYFKDQIDLMITGGAQPNFGPAHLNLVKILAPTCNLEQDAVASILCDMDEEIQALEQRLSKTRQIKQGMMQELLTGKTRLVKPAGAA